MVSEWEQREKMLNALIGERRERAKQHQEDARLWQIERERLRTALDFYARVGVPKGCTPTGDWGPDFLARNPYWQDQGKIAREALVALDKGSKKS